MGIRWANEREFLLWNVIIGCPVIAGAVSMKVFERHRVSCRVVSAQGIYWAIDTLNKVHPGGQSGLWYQ